MRLIIPRKLPPLEGGSVRYTGPAGEVGEDLFTSILEELPATRVLLPFLPRGGVLRDLSSTASWAKWHCDYQHRFFQNSIQEGYFLRCLIVSFEKLGEVNIIFRVEPVSGSGSISYRTYITKTGEDDFVCFES